MVRRGPDHKNIASRPLRLEGGRLHYKLPLVFESQPEGGYTVTSPAVPELLTEGDTVDQAPENVRDAFAAILEISRDLGKALPDELAVGDTGDTVRVHLVVAVP